MNKDNLIDALGQVDDDLYQAADALRQQPVKKKNKVIWVRWAAMAACLCVVVAAGAFVLLPKGGSSSVMASTESMTAVVPAEENAAEGRSAEEEDYADASTDAAAESAIAPQAEEAADEMDGSTNEVSTFSASASSASASAANGETNVTVEMITADRDEALTFTGSEQTEAILTWLSESDALTADEFTAQYGSVTDRANWPAAVTIITVSSSDGLSEPEVWYVPTELPEDLR